LFISFKFSKKKINQFKVYFIHFIKKKKKIKNKNKNNLNKWLSFMTDFSFFGKQVIIILI